MTLIFKIIRSESPYLLYDINFQNYKIRIYCLTLHSYLMQEVIKSMREVLKVNARSFKVNARSFKVNARVFKVNARSFKVNARIDRQAHLSKSVSQSSQ